ncbi:MAG TPA: FapA family protein [Symbiobacteriaceae bacterium]|nr:FapA family protein [Symbiobacteriaceae bacterium]
MNGSADKTSYGLHPQPAHGRVTVRISPDGMEAAMTITPPKGTGQVVSLPQALAALGKAGVIFGVDSQAVEDLVRQASSVSMFDAAGKTTVVARGRPATRGQDAVISHHDLLQMPSGYPQLKSDGSVDHFQLNLVRNVTAGTPLVSKQPATKGVPGTNVLGAPVPCVDGKDQSLRVGKGCRVSDDGSSVIAETEGHAVLGYDGRVTVSPIFEIRGDVDTSTGNIDFVGSVVVMGSIHQGFVVRAGQNVEVHGGIDGGTVEAGGDVIVRYGIQGGSRGRVVAGGRVQCRFIENADVRCHRDLTVGDGILHSKVRCGGKVQITGRRGTIIGGQIKAKDEVITRVLGSSLLTNTDIEVGVSPETRDELEMVRRSLTEAEAGLRKAQQAVTLLRDLEARNPAEFSPEKRAMLLKALRSQYHFQAQRDQLASRKAVLEEELHISLQGRVRAYDTVYPGVKVIIGKETYLVVDSLQHVCFYLSDNHEITLGGA